MATKMMERSSIRLEPKAVEDLRGRLRGLLLLPGEGGYDEARAIWNAMIDRRPALIARCLGVTDVVACVNFAREHALPQFVVVWELPVFHPLLQHAEVLERPAHLLLELLKLLLAEVLAIHAAIYGRHRY